MAKKLTQLVVENYKCLRAINLSLGENITEISGPNGAGKSSTLDAIATLIIGKTAEPEKIIRTGEKKCRIKARIGDLWVERQYEITKYGEMTRRLRLTTAEGTFASTEAVLRDLIGQHMLDPGLFIALKPREKFEALKVFVPDVDFAAIEKAHKRDFDRRTDVNRTAEAALRAAESIVVDPKLPIAIEHDEMDLVRQMQDAAATNQVIQRKQELVKYEKDALARKKIKLIEAQEELEEIQRKIRNLSDEVLEQEQAINNLPPIEPLIDIDQLAKEITEIRKISENVRRYEEQQKHLRLGKKLETEADELTKSIEDRKEAKRKAIAAANLPLPGLSFGDDEILLNGEPFEQASTAEKMTVGVALVCFRNPELRLVWIRDASLLDDKSRAHVKALSEMFDCQILLETVKPGSSDAIVLEDGMVKPMIERE
jgi:predicted ATP-dependent endonuclease of OLD family